MVEFGEQLRRAREAKGMTQQSLAEQLYVTRQSVSRWECGDRYPDLLTTQKISQILEVSLDDLLSGKDMTKVVERNPVIENKVANNIMIVLYAFVVLAYMTMGITIAIRLLIAEPIHFNALDIPLIMTQVIGIGLPIAVFVYGLVNAVMGTLSPKRMGAVLVAYFVGECVSALSLIAYNISVMLLFDAALTIVPAVIAAAASYFFFIRSQNRKVWVIIITIVSVWGVLSSVWSFCVSVGVAIKYYEMMEKVFLAEFLSVSSVLSVIIDVLILYQTYTLYKKRLAAASIADSSCLPSSS